MLLSIPVSKDRGKPFVRTDMPLREKRDSSHNRHRDRVTRQPSGRHGFRPCDRETENTGSMKYTVQSGLS